ncbi:MAG: SDR family NAD(P)-dependent oxidoreductase [Lachnospiraceae bacterium]|nr:SDR family NAD(P)-dependent oxidoreductase [Lachnospiraceae bacterium]
MKHAVVTGASRGIGAAVAESLAERGYALTLTCHSQGTRLERFAEELKEKYGIKCDCFCGDISEESFVDRLFKNIDPPDVLVNNAGISHVGLIQDMTLDQWNRVIGVNLTSAFLTCRRAIPMMLGRGGSIINISSMWGTVGASMEVAYSASKGGLNTYTKALAKELAPSGIQVNALACGVVDTEMNSFLTDEDRQALCDEIPAGRFATVSEVAAAVISIIDAGPYMTGQVIGFDGGI